MKPNLDISRLDPGLLAPIQAPGLAPGRVELKEQFSIDVRALHEGRDGGWIKRLPDVVIGATVYPRFLVRCQGQHCGVVNRNRRMYPAESTWRPHTLEDAPFMRRIGARRVTGQLEHPPDGRSAMPLGAILVTKVEAPDTQGRVFIEFETLTTDLGMVVSHYIMDGVGFGISSRGNGSVIRNAEGVDIVQPDFEPVAFDCVCDESTPGAEVTATLMRLRESRVLLVESARGDVTMAERLAVQRTEEAIARAASAGLAPVPTVRKEDADIAQIAAAAAAAAAVAVSGKGAPPVGPSEYLLAMPDGLGHYRAHMNGQNQWDVWLHVHNLAPERVAANMPTVQNAKSAAENHLRLVVGEAVERGFLTVSGPVTSKVFADLRKKPRRKPGTLMREGYEVKGVQPYTGTMVELVASTEEEAKTVAGALGKAGFHLEQDGDCVYVHTAYHDGEQAICHIARVLNAKDIEMRESVRLATVSRGRVVWCEPVRERVNSAPGDLEPGASFSSFPERAPGEGYEADDDDGDDDDDDPFEIDALADLLGVPHEEPEEPEPMGINLIVIDPDDLGDLLGGDFDEQQDIQTSASRGAPGSADVGPRGTTTGTGPQGYEPQKDAGSDRVSSPGTAMSQSYEDQDMQTPASAGLPGDKGVGDVGAAGGGRAVALDVADAEGVGPAVGPSTAPGASGYSTPGTPPAAHDIPGGGQYETYEAIRARHAHEMAGCPYDGYAEMAMRHHAEMHSMRERVRRHENVNEAGSGYGKPEPLDDPEDIDLDLDHVKEPKVDLNYESAMKKARAYAAEAKRFATMARTLKPAPVSEAALPLPTGARSSASMPRPAAGGKRPAGKVVLWFDEKDAFIEAREFDEKGALIRRVKPKLEEKGKGDKKDDGKADEARRARLAATAKDVMAALSETKPAAPAGSAASAPPTAPASAPVPAATPTAVATSESADELKRRNRHLTDEVARLESRVKQLEDLVDTMAEAQRGANVKASVREVIARHPELETVRTRLESCKRPEDVRAEAGAFVSFAHGSGNGTNGAAPAGKIMPASAPSVPAAAPKLESVAPAPAPAPKTAVASSAQTPDAPTGPVTDVGTDFLGEGLRVSSSVDESDTSRRVADARRRRAEQLNGGKK